MSKNVIALILAFSLFFALSTPSYSYQEELNQMSQGITKDIIKSGKKRVAVVDFTDLKGGTTELGRFIAEELSVDLTRNSQKYEVIDRGHLKSILTEHKFELSGLVDAQTVKELGKIAGVDLLVTGMLTPFGDSIRISCKILNTASAKVIGARKTEIAKTRSIENMLAHGIDSGDKPSSAPPPKFEPREPAPAETEKPPQEPPPAEVKKEEPPKKAPPPDVPRPAKKGYKSIATKHEDDYVYELLSVTMSQNDITCTFAITNKIGYWRNLTFYGEKSRYVKSKIFDSNGKAYDVNQVFTYENDKHTLVKDSEGIRIEDGQTITVQFVFRDVPNMKAIKTLNLHTYSGTRTVMIWKWREHDVPFKNVAVSRR